MSTQKPVPSKKLVILIVSLSVKVGIGDTCNRKFEIVSLSVKVCIVDTCSKKL